MPPKNKRKPTEPVEIAEESADANVPLSDLVFEDPFGDDFEDEDLVDDDGEDEEEDDENDDDEAEDGMDEDEKARIDESMGGSGVSREPTRVWRPGVDQLPEGEELEYDPSAYILYHSLRTEWPCLSFDVMKDSLGDSRSRFPLTMFMICGSQAERPDKNCLTLLKLSDLNKTQEGGDDDDDDDDDDDENVDDDPTLEHVNIPHHGGVNRIRCMPQASGIVATMADTGSVHIYDLTQPFRGMQQRGPAVPPSLTVKPEFTFKGNRQVSSDPLSLSFSHQYFLQICTFMCSARSHEQLIIYGCAVGGIRLGLVASDSWSSRGRGLLWGD
jgi:ribosome assembly protein RRB1